MGQVFTPRKEFLRQTSPPHLLFPLPNQALLLPTPGRNHSESGGPAISQIDPDNGHCEFVFVGKPWSNVKSARSERLVANIFTVILKHDYTLLSPLDYGRDSHWPEFLAN